MGDSDEGPAAAVNAFFRQHHKQHIVCLRCIKVFEPTKAAARNNPHLHCGSPTEEEDPDEVMLEVVDFARAKSKKHAHDIATKLIAARDKAIRAGVAADRAARRAPAAAADEAATGDEGTEEGDDQDGDSSSEESDGEGTDSEEEEGTRDPAVDNPADSARATATASGKQPTVTKDILTAVVLSLRIAPNDDLREAIQHALETYFIPATASNGVGSSPAARALADILGIPGSARRTLPWTWCVPLLACCWAGHAC